MYGLRVLAVPPVLETVRDALAATDRGVSPATSLAILVVVVLTLSLALALFIFAGP